MYKTILLVLVYKHFSSDRIIYIIITLNDMLDVMILFEVNMCIFKIYLYVIKYIYFFYKHFYKIC